MAQLSCKISPSQGKVSHFFKSNIVLLGGSKCCKNMLLMASNFEPVGLFLYKKRPDGLWPKIRPIQARAFCLFSKSPSPIFGLGLEPDPALFPTQPVYTFIIVIHQNAMLIFKCFCFCLYHRFERIFLSFVWFILMNAQMSTQLLKTSFKYMICSGRKHQFPRNFLRWQAPGCTQVYSFKSMDFIIGNNA